MYSVFGMGVGESCRTFFPKCRPMVSPRMDDVAGTLGLAALSTTVNLQAIDPNKGQCGMREIQGSR